MKQKWAMQEARGVEGNQQLDQSADGPWNC